MRNSDTKAILRKTLRAARLSLSSEKVLLHSRAIIATISALASYRHAHQVGCYFPVQNEIDLTPLILTAWNMQKKIYLPIISEHNDMDFYAYTQTTPLVKNRYGIAEPSQTANLSIAPQDLDLLLIPLVAFDANRNRLGQGMGFYDRYLSQYQKTKKRPITIGVGYELQKVTHVPTDTGDIPLDIIVSEKQVYSSMF